MGRNNKVKFWREMYPYIKKYRKKLIFSAFGSIIVGIFVALQPFIIKYIVDDGISNPNFNSKQKVIFIGLMCLIYLIFGGCRILIWKITFKGIMTSMQGALFNLRSRFFSHLQDMSMQFYSTVSVGELFNCIIGSPINSIEQYMFQMFQSVPYQAVSLVVSVIALLSFDWFLTVMLLITVMFMVIVNNISYKKIEKIYGEYLKTESETSKHLNNTLHGMDTVKIHAVEKTVFHNFRAFLKTLYEKGIVSAMAQTNESFKPEIIEYIGVTVITMVGGVFCVYRGLSVGTLYAFLTSIYNIFYTLLQLMEIRLQKSRAESGLKKILDIMEKKTTTPEKNADEQKFIETEKEKAEKNNMPCIEFNNVSFGYNDNKIFSHFSCSVRHNESVALVGLSGSGKSTLTKLILRLYDVSEGKVLVYGTDVKDYNMNSLRTSFGVVPQKPFIFYGSVWDNIKIARPEASDDEIIKAMEIANVNEFVNAMEQGRDTIIGDGGASLSGGQTQRIAIARAVLGNPDILIFDEATSSLDNISEKQIQKAMENLMKDHTIIIIAHRLSTIKNVDRILVLKDGAITEEGTYTELQNKEGVFSEFLNI